MHYFLYEMGKNPDVQEKLYQEINSVLKVDEPITEDHLSKLKYLKYSTKENFRLANHALKKETLDLLIQNQSKHSRGIGIDTRYLQSLSILFKELTSKVFICI